MKCNCGADAKGCKGTLQRGQGSTGSKQAICNVCGKTVGCPEMHGQPCSGYICSLTGQAIASCPATPDQAFAGVGEINQDLFRGATVPR